MPRLGVWWLATVVVAATGCGPTRGEAPEAFRQCDEAVHWSGETRGVGLHVLGPQTVVVVHGGRGSDGAPEPSVEITDACGGHRQAWPSGLRFLPGPSPMACDP